jgi:hypothetical protein
MGSRNVFAVLLSLAIFSALSLSLYIAGSDSSEGEEKEKIVMDFIWGGWDFKIGNSLSEMRRVGKVQRELTSFEDNRHVEDQKDEIRGLFFDGLYIRALFPAKNHRNGLITVVEITKPTWKIKHGLNVGVSIKKVMSVLGESYADKNNVYSYYLDPQIGMRSVYFHTQKGVVKKVEWISMPD